MTIAGLHTKLETNQLLAATQSRVDDIQDAYDANATEWRAGDAATQDQWSRDWQTWKDQWVKALVEVNVIQSVSEQLTLGSLAPLIDLSSTAQNLEPDESNYQRVVEAIAWPGSTDSVVDGNLPGLDGRLRKGIGDFSRRIPPPQNAEDFDLDFINSTPAVFATSAVNDASGIARAVSKVTPTNPVNFIFGILAAGGAILAALVGFNVLEAKTIKKAYDKVTHG